MNISTEAPLCAQSYMRTGENGGGGVARAMRKDKSLS